MEKPGGWKGDKRSSSNEVLNNDLHFRVLLLTQCLFLTPSTLAMSQNNSTLTQAQILGIFKLKLGKS